MLKKLLTEKAIFSIHMTITGGMLFFTSRFHIFFCFFAHSNVQNKIQKFSYKLKKLLTEKATFSIHMTITGMLFFTLHMHIFFCFFARSNV
jgi:hypothetical protein